MMAPPLQIREHRLKEMKGLSKGTKQVFGRTGQESWHPGHFRETGTPVSWGNGSERRDAVRRKDTLAKLSYSLELAPTADTCRGRKTGVSLLLVHGVLCTLPRASEPVLFKR